MVTDLAGAPGDRQVTLEQLRAFVLVAGTGSFHQAAEQLHRSQPALTQSLKRLETYLGASLIRRRQGHILGLTKAGEIFLPAAQDILARTSDAISTLRRPQLSGRIRMAIPEDIKVADLQQKISRCVRLNRTLKIEVTSAPSAEIARMVADKAVDLALLKRISGPTSPGKYNHLLREEPLCWVAQNLCNITDYTEVPLVCFPTSCAYRQAGMAALAQTGFDSYPAYETASYGNLHAAIMAGLGVGILPRSAVKGLTILGQAEGFPILPNAQLLLTELTDSPPVRHLSALIRTAAKEMQP